MDGLSERDQDLLTALAGGETLNDYARRHNYSLAWGQWRSRELRRLLGVATLREAVLMSQGEGEGVSRGDFEKLFSAVSGLTDAVEEMRKRPSEPQQQQVRERELDVKDHAKALGLSLEDVERLKGEKEYEKWLAFETRRQKELDEEEGVEGEGEGENGKGKGIGEQIRDGLGGIRNVKPS